jgi:hypothetical protein
VFGRLYIPHVWQRISLMCGRAYIPPVRHAIYPSCVAGHISLMCGRAYIPPVWQGIYPSCLAGHISFMCDRLIPVSIMLPPWQGLYPSCAACHISLMCGSAYISSVCRRIFVVLVLSLNMTNLCPLSCGWVQGCGSSFI